MSAQILDLMPKLAAKKANEKAEQERLEAERIIQEYMDQFIVTGVNVTPPTYDIESVEYTIDLSTEE